MKKSLIIMALLSVAGIASAKEPGRCFFNEHPEAASYGFVFDFDTNASAAKAYKLVFSEGKDAPKGKTFSVRHPTREESSEDCMIAEKSGGLVRAGKTFGG